MAPDERGAMVDRMNAHYRECQCCQAARGYIDRLTAERDAWRELAEAMEAAQTASTRNDTTDEDYRAAWARVRAARRWRRCEESSARRRLGPA